MQQNLVTRCKIKQEEVAPTAHSSTLSELIARRAPLLEKVEKSLRAQDLNPAP